MPIYYGRKTTLRVHEGPDGPEKVIEFRTDAFGPPTCDQAEAWDPEQGIWVPVAPAQWDFLCAEPLPLEPDDEPGA